MSEAGCTVIFMQRQLASLELLRDEVRIERDAQLRHFDALDAKAGIILGFAGVIAALAPLDRSVLIDIGRLWAVPEDCPPSGPSGREPSLFSNSSSCGRDILAPSRSSLPVDSLTLRS